MLHRFATYEEAALFAALKRDQGHMADILHDHTAMLWGPLALGGVSVLVSEEAAGEEDELPVAAQGHMPWMPAELTLIIGHSVLAVLLLSFAYAGLRLLQIAALYPVEAVFIMARIAVVAVILGLLAWLLGWLMSAWAHMVWDGQHVWHGPACFTLQFIAAMLLLSFLM